MLSHKNISAFTFSSIKITCVNKLVLLSSIPGIVVVGGEYKIWIFSLCTSPYLILLPLWAQISFLVENYWKHSEFSLPSILETIVPPNKITGEIAVRIFCSLYYCIRNKRKINKMKNCIARIICSFFNVSQCIFQFNNR